MLCHFHTGNVTFFNEDENYFRKRLEGLQRFMSRGRENSDSVNLHVHIEKNRHHSGKRFKSKATIFYPGKVLHAEVDTENIKKGADLLNSKLKHQLEKIHGSH